MKKEAQKEPTDQWRSVALIFSLAQPLPEYGKRAS